MKLQGDFKMQNDFSRLRAMQVFLARESDRPPIFCIAKNQAPNSKNGKRKMFKQNRRTQIKNGFKNKVS